MFGWFGVPLLRKAPRSNHSMGCRTPRAWIEPLALPPGRNLPSPWGEQLFHGGNDENLWLTLLPLFCERRNANMETIKSTGNSMNFALHTGHTVLKHLHIYIYIYIHIHIHIHIHIYTLKNSTQVAPPQAHEASSAAKSSCSLPRMASNRAHGGFRLVMGGIPKCMVYDEKKKSSRKKWMIF